jgi:predicted type IV restriction endonuclease
MVIEEPDYSHKGVKILALIEKILLMRSRFYAPQEIRNMIVSHEVSVRIETDGKYTVWIIADKD